jgi:hypothetical protein
MLVADFFHKYYPHLSNKARAQFYAELHAVVDRAAADGRRTALIEAEGACVHVLSTGAFTDGGAEAVADAVRRIPRWDGSAPFVPER